MLILLLIASGVGNARLFASRSWTLPTLVLSSVACHRLSDTVATAQPTPEPTPESAPGGEHARTESPPVTVPDLDRLLGSRFTVDEVVSEIERRGVLKLPDPPNASTTSGCPAAAACSTRWNVPGTCSRRRL